MSRQRILELLLGNVTLAVFLVIFLYFGLQAPRFIGVKSIANIVKQASFTGVVAVGMTFVLLTAGIDLSVGSNMYLSAMSAGYLMQNPAFQNGWGVALAIAAGLLTGMAFGAVNGFCVVVLRITPFLVTLATLVAGRGLGTAITEVLRHRVSRVLSCFWRLFVLRHSDADHCFRRGRPRRPYRFEPQPIRPPDLCGGQ